MTIKKLRGPLAALLLFSLVGQSSDLQAWNMSRIWPKVRAIGHRINVIGHRFVHSRYFVPLAALATIVVAGCVGYALQDNAARPAPVPVPPAPPQLPRLNGVHDQQQYPVPPNHPAANRQAQQPARVDRRPRPGFVDRFTDEGYLRREQIQLGGARYIPGRGILVPAARGDGQIRVQQALVLNQFGANSGGGASCGYQALKNACGIASTLLGTDRREWLTNRETVNQLFGPARQGTAAGPWRARIIQERDKQALRYHIEHLMPVNDVDGIDGQFDVQNIRERYLGLHREYVAEIVDRLFAGEEFIEVTANTFVDWLQTRPIDIVDPTEYGTNVTADAIREYIRNRDTVLEYIGIEKDQVLRCSRAMLPAARKTYNGDARNTGKFNTITFNGEWLHGGEIDLLIRDMIRREEAPLADIPIHVLDSIAPRVLEHNDDVTAVRNAIRDGHALPHQVYAFVLGNMYHDGDDTGGDGHWMTLVLDTLENNQRRYTLADSGGNAVRLYGGTCHQFIRYLEGDPVAERLRLPDEHREPGVTGWFAHKWRQFDNWLDTV